MTSNTEAIKTLRDARDVIETALDRTTTERDRTELRARHDDVADEIRALHRLRLDAQTSGYAPMTAHIGEAIHKLDRLKQRLVRLNKGARTADQVLGVVARLAGLVA